MKNLILIAGLLLLPVAAAAQAQDYQTISTGVVSGVYVSSQTPTRVDNLVNGVTGQVLQNRTEIEISVPGGASAGISCGFDVLVSSIPPTLTAASGRLGLEYAKGLAPARVPLPTNMAYWCLGQSASAGIGISVKQLSPFRPGRF